MWCIGVLTAPSISRRAFFVKTHIRHYRRWGGCAPPSRLSSCRFPRPPRAACRVAPSRGGCAHPPRARGCFLFVSRWGFLSAPPLAPGRVGAPLLARLPAPPLWWGRRSAPTLIKKKGAGFFLYLCPALVGTPRSASLSCVTRAGCLPATGTKSGAHACTQASPAP